MTQLGLAASIRPHRYLAVGTGNTDHQAAARTDDRPRFVRGIGGDDDRGSIAEGQVKRSYFINAGRSHRVRVGGEYRSETASVAWVEVVVDSAGGEHERRFDHELHVAHLEASLVVDTNPVEISLRHLHGAPSAPLDRSRKRLLAGPDVRRFHRNMIAPRSDAVTTTQATVRE